jgi:hypothetical protein
MANIGEPMRRHHVIPLDYPIPATTEPNLPLPKISSGTWFLQ